MEKSQFFFLFKKKKQTEDTRRRVHKGNRILIAIISEKKPRDIAARVRIELQQIFNRALLGQAPYCDTSPPKIRTILVIATRPNIKN